MQTAEQLAAQEIAAGPRLVAASKAEAQSHAEFFRQAQEDDAEFAGSVEGRHAHNMANIACGWIAEDEPRYLADFMPSDPSPAFSVVQIRTTYDRAGHVVSQEQTTVGRFADHKALYRYLFDRSDKPGVLAYFLTLNDRESVRLSKRYNGAEIDFAEIFRMVEGDEAFNAVMEDRAPAQVEELWAAAQVAA